MQRPTLEEMTRCLTLRPEDKDMPPSKVWLHVTGKHDTGILLEVNGHTVGWLSAFEIGRIALMLSKNVQ